MDYSTWAILLLLIGVALLLADVFVPSGGLISLAAAVALLIAVWCAWQAWWVGSPAYFLTFLAGMALILPIVVCLAFYVWPHTPFGKSLIIAAPTQAEIASFTKQEERLSGLVGRLASTATMLNPAGMILVDGERLHCQSEGMIIDAGARVRVLAVHGNRLVVRRLTEREVADAQAAEHETPASGPLDFDMT